MLCQTRHWSRQRCPAVKAAAPRAAVIGALRRRNTIVERKQRWDREKYNIYQRLLMRKRRRLAKARQRKKK